VLRLGLCCGFVEEPIRFRTTTVRYASSLAPPRRRAFLRELAVHNAAALDASVAWCAAHGAGAFRVPSGLLPVATHPAVGYRVSAAGRRATAALVAAGQRARAAGVRLSFHPDQFVVPGSPNAAVAESSRRELEHQAELAELLGAEQVTIHGGGAQEGKPAALARLARALGRLSPRARRVLVLENDDRVYTVADLLPLCRAEGVPLVYDVHHHRCNADGLSVAEATDLAAATWGAREPWAHISSPLAGWGGGDPRPHADFIRAGDLPTAWLGRRLTVDVEAKAKEKAVARLGAWLRRQRAAA
jgi:UV DNA damage endonuclease